MIISFTIPGPPRGKGRPRASTQGGFARLYTDEKTASYENLVKLACQGAMAGQRLSGPVRVVLTAKFPWPKSMSRKERRRIEQGGARHTKKPDIDNVVKAVLDGMNGVGYGDDAKVTDLVAVKVYSDSPGLDVVLQGGDALS